LVQVRTAFGLAKPAWFVAPVEESWAGGLADAAPAVATVTAANTIDMNAGRHIDR
jgi:hypothetical protein